MKPLYLKPNHNAFFYRGVCTLFAVLILSSVTAQVIKVPKADKHQRVIITYKMDLFYIDPSTLMNELIWQNKFTGESNFTEEIKYLRMASEKIEYKYGQKEFRNMSEDKIYKVLLKLLPKLICEEKVAHFDKNMKKNSMTLTVALCEEKQPGYATITTQKGKVIFDCDGNYLP